MSLLPVCMPVCHARSWWPRRLRESIGSFGTGIINSVSHWVETGIEPRLSGRAVSGFMYRVISPAALPEAHG